MSDLKGLPSCLIHTHTHTHAHTHAQHPAWLSVSQSSWTRSALLFQVLEPPTLGPVQTVGTLVLAACPSCSCHQRSGARNAITASTVRQGDELGPKPAAPKLSPRACLRGGCVEKGGLVHQDRGASLGRWMAEGGETEPGVMAQSTRGEGSDGLPLRPLWPHPNPSTRSGCLTRRVFIKQSTVGKPGPE